MYGDILKSRVIYTCKKTITSLRLNLRKIECKSPSFLLLILPLISQSKNHLSISEKERVKAFEKSRSAIYTRRSEFGFIINIDGQTCGLCYIGFCEGAFSCLLVDVKIYFAHDTDSS